MASYRGHLAVSSVCGVGYGAAGVQPLGFDADIAAVAAGVTAVAGLLPDLDSDSGVPIRELFGIAAVAVPLMCLRRLENTHWPQEDVILIMAGMYATIRYGLSRVFKRITVHRGMFHSVPAMLIAGLSGFLLYEHPDITVRAFIAGGALVGYLSHLLLDEWSSVDFRGLRPRLNKYAGSAVKFTSKSAAATAVCYVILGGLLFVALRDVEAHSGVPIIPGFLRDLAGG